MKRTLFFLVLLTLLAGCGLWPLKKDTQRAEATLVAFFDHLSKKEYDQADALYGADYEALTYFNPAIPKEDHVALWRNACEVNGYRCLPVLRVVSSENFSLNEYMITVEFRGADGNAFVFSPCCGANGEEMPPQSQFVMFVIERDGRYLITSLPVYAR